MKIVLAGSKEYFGLYLTNFLISKGHDVVNLDLNQKIVLPQCDALVSYPERFLIENKKGPEVFKKEFLDTRTEPTRRLKAAIEEMKTPPSVWVSFSSVAYYPKEKEAFFKEDGEEGKDPVGQLVGEWERAAQLPDGHPTRVVIPRSGLLMSRLVGILPVITPLFKIGLGSIIGKGTEAFPWIHIKDLCWIVLFGILDESVQGVYNAVAPQNINSEMFSEALAQVMHKKIFLKLPRRYFQRKLGDVAEIVFARSIVFPSRLLKSGFTYRYPAIYTALVEEFSSS